MQQRDANVNEMQEDDSLEEQWVCGVATHTYVCETTKRLMYTVEVDGRVLQILFGEIQTLYSPCESEEEEENINWAEEFELISNSCSSESDKELDLLLLNDNIGREGSQILAYNSEIPYGEERSVSRSKDCTQTLNSCTEVMGGDSY